jgi:hypothetical protein
VCERGDDPITGLPTRAHENSPKNSRFFTKNPQNIIIPLKFPKNVILEQVLGPLKSPMLATLSYECRISHQLQCEYGAHFLARVTICCVIKIFNVYKLNSNIAPGV